MLFGVAVRAACVLPHTQSYAGVYVVLSGAPLDRRSASDSESERKREKARRVYRYLIEPYTKVTWNVTIATRACEWSCTLEMHVAPKTIQYIIQTSTRTCASTHTHTPSLVVTLTKQYQWWYFFLLLLFRLAFFCSFVDLCFVFVTTNTERERWLWRKTRSIQQHIHTANARSNTIWKEMEIHGQTLWSKWKKVLFFL